MKARWALPALLLILASTAATGADQYEKLDYYIQQMITAAVAKDQASVQTFREQLDNLPRREPGDSAQARSFRQQGLDQLARNNFKEALAAFRQAFIADPADPDIAGQLSLTYLRLRRLKEAERLAVYTLSLAPGQSAAWFTPVSYTHLDVYKRQIRDRVGAGTAHRRPGRRQTAESGAAVRRHQGFMSLRNAGRRT